MERHDADAAPYITAASAVALWRSGKSTYALPANPLPRKNYVSSSELAAYAAWDRTPGAFSMYPDQLHEAPRIYDASGTSWSVTCVTKEYAALSHAALARNGTRDALRGNRRDPPAILELPEGGNLVARTKRALSHPASYAATPFRPTPPAPVCADF